MSKFRILVLFFFSLIASTTFSEEPSAWEDIFVHQGVDGFSLELKPDRHLFIQIPPNYNYAYSDVTENGSLIEFVPEGESVDHWSSIFTLVLIPYTTPHFEDFVRQYLGPQFPAYDSALEFKLQEGIEAFFYKWINPAFKIPECTLIEGKDEVTMKVGFQGDYGIYILVFAYRYDQTIPDAQKERKNDAFFQLLMSCYDILQ